LIRSIDGFRTRIVFCNPSAKWRSSRSLQRHGFSAVALHGDLDQSARTAALDQFRCGEIPLLIASDVAARGPRYSGVSHIFNFDVPHHADDYVHRIGRTGRAGRTGTAITLVTPADVKAVAAIEKLIGQTIAWTGAPALAEADDGSLRGVASRAAAIDPFGRQPARTPAPVAQLAQRDQAAHPSRASPSRAVQEPRRPEPADDAHMPAFCSARCA